jgi:hypothetical protein
MIVTNEPGIIGIEGLDSMIRFIRFHPLNVSNFLEGLELAADLKNEAGITLYPKDTELTREKFNRLLKLHENNAKAEFNFKIKRSEKLFLRLRQELQERMLLLLERRQKTKVFKGLTLGLETRLIALLSKILDDQELILALYEFRFIGEGAQIKKAFLYTDHPLNLAIFALALAVSEQLKPIVGDDQEKLLQTVKASLFHNYRAGLEIERLFQVPEVERQKLYWETCRRGLKNLETLKIDEEVISGIKGLYDYQEGKRDFVNKMGWGATLSNILVTAEHFLRRESGMFGEQMEARQVVDQMNVKVKEKLFNAQAVEALTLGLNLNDIFDYYAELDRLLKECPFEAAMPYPLTGFRSATIFICKKTVLRCPHLELTIKAVKLIARMGELTPGEYHRCKLLTPRLLAFYDEYYDKIKEDTSGRKPKAEVKPSSKPAPDAKKAAEPEKKKEGFNDDLTEIFNKMPPKPETPGAKPEPSGAKPETPGAS